MFNLIRTGTAASVAAILCLTAAAPAFAGSEREWKHDRDREEGKHRYEKRYRDKGGHGNRPVFSGNCAELPADRTTEFHGTPFKSELNLAMAGNQWVVFNKVLQGFNQRRVANGESRIDTDGLVNKPRTREELRRKGNRYFVELIPPGQERNQIKSGCMLLGNEDDRNFLPHSIQVDFDIFTSTNYNLMRDLGKSGFVKEAFPYIRNQLTLMTDADNSAGIGGSDGSDIIDATLDLLSPGIRVSEVDHINEGVHRGINKMYKAMDEYVRLNGTPADISALDAALAAVSIPQDGSPAATRTDVSTDFNLSTNPECHYSGHPTIADGTLRLCEFAVLNKANTHETRVHHVETPERILANQSDVGPVWVSELQLAVDNGDAVGGSQMPDSVNRPVVYSIAFLSTMKKKHRRLAKEFMEYMRTDAVQIYVDGGFSALTGDEQGERYSLDANGDLVIEPIIP